MDRPWHQNPSPELSPPPTHLDLPPFPHVRFLTRLWESFLEGHLSPSPYLVIPDHWVGEIRVRMMVLVSSPPIADWELEVLVCFPHRIMVELGRQMDAGVTAGSQPRMALVRAHHPVVVVLLETRVSGMRSEMVKNRMGFSDESGSSGSMICYMWRF
ncbi:hypothetical protein Acr_00g0079990 [Actinidia rufa]|uniref:Uncharacterized protein n=1 Tax=Actinidia rufa TaxID=165716 RepID=A0A7J0DTY0_9ERIC|nr:hypothetical protein Acr_00g0079990 [Actinidia rufa]